jgi:DNA-binding transcriptional regulator YiaG
VTAEKFKSIRKEIGSQHDVANRLGVSQAQISIWEMGYKEIPEDISSSITMIHDDNVKK